MLALELKDRIVFFHYEEPSAVQMVDFLSAGKIEL
jgi:hypothetical protein